ncbi:prostaglandin E2 receptor EP2 subtype-like [Babylonia areolata]|uniref:prostaglandin E2 receptor EP2 subtype-like n=1 Tax=Babylonia areolata TaxID=304850 RepID=UPI003FD17D19
MTLTATAHTHFTATSQTAATVPDVMRDDLSTNMTSGLYWPSANVTASPRDHLLTLLHGLGGEGEGEGQTTAMMLGQAVMTEGVVGEGGNGSVAALGRTVSTALKNHTVMVSCLMFGAGVLGNVLALVVLATSGPEQRKTLFYKLVAGLAVTDLLGTTATSPVVIAVYNNDFRWVGGDALCHYFSFAMIFACFATMLIVCAMSVERYVCVRHPYVYHTRLSGTKFARLTLLSCWALSVVIASLPLLGVGTNVRQYPRTWCFFDYLSRRTSDVVFNYLFAILALVCVLVTFVCNVSVIYTLVTLRSRQSRLDASETSSSQGKRRSRASSQRFAEVQMMVMLIGITVVFTFCFAPLIIFVLVCQTSLQFDSRSWVLLLIRIASFNPILDPWVYILCRRELVWRCVKLARCLLRLEPKQRPLYLQQSLLYKDGEGAARGGGVMAVVNGGKRDSGGGGERVGMGSTGDAAAVGVFSSSGGKGWSWEDPYNPSCLAFCYQCLCLPPAPRGASAMTSRGLSFTASKINRSPSLMTSRKAVGGGGSTPTETSQPPSSSSLSRSSSRLAMKPPLSH